MQIPEKAKLVFKGKIFDVYQWEQELYDKSTTTFEALKRPSTLQVIATIGNKILLGRETQPFKKACYTLLGGRQDPGENELEGAQRELLEESGYISEDWNEIRRYMPSIKMDWNVIIFSAKNCVLKKKADPGPGEIIEVVSVDFDKFIEIVTSDEFWGQEFALDIFRMKEKGKLDEFKKMLFS